MTSAREAAVACGLPFAEVPPRLPPRELLASLPMQYARRHLVLPLGRGPDTLEVALADPTALAPLDDLRLLYGLRIQPVVVPANALREAIARAYDAAAAAASEDGSTLGARLELDATALDDAEPPDLLEAGEDAPAIRLVNAVLYEAVRASASDVHVEPFERSVAVRLRVDGVLQDLLAPPLSMHAALVSRVKIMAGLDIAERRLPHDGRIALRVGGRDVDVRVSIVPTAAGERMVLRLLDRASVLRDVAELGLTATTTGGLETLLARSHGLLLVTGPTGSGKTTTLYALLRRLATGERNIMTIEDPIEYQLRGIGQLQVAPRIGTHVRGGVALDPAPGPRRHPGGRDPRSRDHGDRAAGRAHRPPRAGDAAHQRCLQHAHPAARHGRRAVSHRVLDRGRCWRSGWCAACAATARVAGARAAGRAASAVGPASTSC